MEAGGAKLEAAAAPAPARYRIKKRSTPTNFANAAAAPPPPPPAPLAPPLPAAELPGVPAELKARERHKRTKNLTIPDGWVHCSNGGEAICGIVPVKTPLSAEFTEDRPELQWTPSDCVRACGGERVGLVVDLTAATRYYSQDELPPGVQYLKLAIGGHTLPPPPLVERFLAEVQDLRARRGPDVRVVVHCTHGINRTGFVVAIALCRLHGMSLVDALAEFGRVRPPGTWRAEYVHALHDSFGGPPPQLPQPPPWEAKADAPTGPDPNMLPPPPPPFGAFGFGR
jgi:mRNA-capping enzyme